MIRPGATLGVLGGMGPAATAEFLRLLAERVPAHTDQEHPRILLLSEPSVPDRSAALLAGVDTPLPVLRDGLATLVGWGADLLAVPCNTAHVFLDRIGAGFGAPLVHIADATLRAAVRASPGGAWLTATAGTVASGLYQRRAAELGFRLFLPDAGRQEALDETIRLVKAGRPEEAGGLHRTTSYALWRRRHVPLLAACTELPLAHLYAGLPPEMAVSSLAALASACVDELYPVADEGGTVVRMPPPGRHRGRPLSFPAVAS